LHLQLIGKGRGMNAAIASEGEQRELARVATTVG